MMRRLIGAVHSPRIYLLIQRLLGFHGARRWCLEQMVRPRPGMRVLDVGCGPGAVRDLLGDVEYTGFDTDTDAIEYARRRHAGGGLFVDGELDARIAARRGPFDRILLFGILHHLDDGKAAQLLATCRGLLATGGSVFTLDGCYRSGQPRIDRFQLDHDQGEYVRDRVGYVSLARNTFPVVEERVLDEHTRLPYTLFVMECRGDSPRL